MEDVKVSDIDRNESNDKPTTDVTIFIDNQAVQVRADNNLLAGVLSNKLNLPYFCWHPSMGSVGACRQCAVTQYQDENDTRGRLVMACTTPITDGMRISLKDTQSEKFREQVIAAMMTNHPHDCPVCAEGGECHLQDMTVMTGHSCRSYKGDKRTFTNQNLGEFVGHEMNRCITCYRCVRYYKDYAGGDDFGVYGSKNQVYFGRQKAGQLESEFSGNLVEVCPTGVFTNKLFSAHFSRKWDLQSAPSICAHCSVGCNTSVGERYGSVRRVMNRYHDQLNGHFLCDRGRFGLGFVNGEQRIRQTKGIPQQSVERLTRLDVNKALAHFNGKKFIGIGSARASIEANYYLQKLVGDNYFSLGLTNTEMSLAAQHRALLSTHSKTKSAAPSLHDIEQCDFVFIIDEDITQTSPRVALSVRQALRNAAIEKAAGIGIPHWQDSAVRTIGGKLLSPLYLLQSKASKLDDVAEDIDITSPKSLIAKVNDITTQLKKSALTSGEQLDDSFTARLITAFKQAKNPLIIGGWSAESPALFTAITKLFEELSNITHSTQLLMMPPQVNSIGLLSLMTEQSLSLEQVIDHAQNEGAEGVSGLIILENELAALSVEQFALIKKQDLNIISLDHSKSEASANADIILPVSAVSESDGHFINYQARVQKFSQVHPTALPIQENWRWLNLLAMAVFPKNNLSKNVRSLAQLHQLFAEEHDDWLLDTMNEEHSIARETHRVSGRTAKNANFSVHEPKTTQSSSKLKFSMEGELQSDQQEKPFTWAPGWNSSQSINQLTSQPVNQSGKTDQFLSFFQLSPITDQWLTFCESLREVNFSLQVPWYRGEWQSSLNPEFILLNQENKVFISPQAMKKGQWQQGQWLTLRFSHLGEDASSVVAQAFQDERLSDDYLYADINLSLANTESNSVASSEEERAMMNSTEIKLSTANQQDLLAYQQAFNNREKHATTDKANALARLKNQDQYIPIRLVSGGLDDV